MVIDNKCNVSFAFLIRSILQEDGITIIIQNMNYLCVVALQQRIKKLMSFEQNDVIL